MNSKATRRGKNHAFYEAYKKLEDEEIVQKLTLDQLRVRFSKFKRYRKDKPQITAVLFYKLNMVDYSDAFLARVEEVALVYYGIRCPRG